MQKNFDEIAVRARGLGPKKAIIASLVQFLTNMFILLSPGYKFIRHFSGPPKRPG